ncbi:MAG: hypothetical protein Q8O89_07565 [Nanoarchaeota archaeon]|nr:hypothetical protein [Nanoarchaeota archaeon]
MVLEKTASELKLEKRLKELSPIITKQDLPSVIEKHEFKKGLIETEKGLMVPAYVASQLGFSFPGKYFLDNYFHPKLIELNIFPLCPFTACAEYLNFSIINNDNRTVKKHKQFWDYFNKDIVGPVNYTVLMPRTQMLIAIFDGGHTVDDGVSEEVGVYAKAFHTKPIIGIRSDIRLAENMAASINPAVRFHVDIGKTNGSFFEGTAAYDNAFKCLGELSEKIMKECKNK